MNAGIKVIVGLGNPGGQYKQTRHNVGFWWVEQLAADKNISFSVEAKFHALLARVTDLELWLVQPQTFMNISGRTVAALANYYKLEPQQILVVHDELDLDPGVARLKKGGGAGGHNGLKSIITELGVQDFWRLRLGIGHPGHRDEVTDYVLNRPNVTDQALIQQAIEQSLKSVPELHAGKFEMAMQALHTKIEPIKDIKQT